MSDECTTWRQLRDRIDSMPEDRLDDQAEVLLPDPTDRVRELAPVIGMDTIGNYEVETRGSVDNLHHADRFVLLADCNPFDEDGNFCYELTDDGMIGNKTGKNYGPFGPRGE